jgi:hypothetical protein
MASYSGSGLYVNEQKASRSKPGYLKGDVLDEYILPPTGDLTIPGEKDKFDWELAEILGHQFFQNYRPNPNFDGRMQFPNEARERFCDIKLIPVDNKEDFDQFIDDIKTGKAKLELSHAQLFADFWFPGSCCYIAVAKMKKENKWKSVLIKQDGRTFSSYSEYYSKVNEMLDLRNTIFEQKILLEPTYIDALKTENKTIIRTIKNKLRNKLLNDCAYEVFELYYAVYE